MNAGYIILIIVGVIGLIIGYAMFMNRSATSGLIKANIKAYMTARNRHMSHEKALQWVIHSRYRFEKKKRNSMYELFLSDKQELVSDLFPEVNETTLEECELKALILFIFVSEINPTFAENKAEEMLTKVDLVYKNMMKTEKYL